MWAAIDGRRYVDAQRHMREAQALAEMSGDQAIKFRIRSHTGSMYRHRGRPSDAFAANEVARGLHITRRDPMFASPGLARHAAIHGAAQERTGTKRAFDQAQEAIDRADPHASRPVWLVAFYDQAELDSLALSAYLALGDYQTAEAHAPAAWPGCAPTWPGPAPSRKRGSRTPSSPRARPMPPWLRQ